MQLSVVNFKKVANSSRIDAEYFEPSHLYIEKQLHGLDSPQLSEFADVVASAFYPSATEYYAEGETPFIRCVDLVPSPFVLAEPNLPFARLPKDFLNQHSSIQHLAQFEIAVSKVGSPCFASLIHDLSSVALSRTVLGIKNITNINPYYLTIFLRCKYGFQQLLRERELTIQYQLTLDRVRSLQVFKPKNSNLENKIELLFQKSIAQSKNSRTSLKLAQEKLLKAIGLNGWQPKKQLCFVADYSEVVEAQRFDSDYFQPHYKELMKRISCFNSIPLSKIVNYQKGVEVGSDAYEKEGIPFIRVSDISENGFEKTEKHISSELYQEFKDNHAPKKGDILFTKDGTIGRSFVVQEDKEAILSSAFLKLTINPNVNVQPDYLALVLNSVICKLQIDRLSGGAIIAHLKPSDAMAIKIPVLNDHIQAEVCSMVRQSRLERDESKRLLEVAKRAVEIAIEEDEPAAFSFIDRETG